MNPRITITSNINDAIEYVSKESINTFQELLNEHGSTILIDDNDDGFKSWCMRYHANKCGGCSYNCKLVIRELKLKRILK